MREKVAWEVAGTWALAWAENAFQLGAQTCQVEAQGLVQLEWTDGVGVSGARVTDQISREFTNTPAS